MRKINYPLIVSDFDGTLVNADGTISEKNKKAIAEYVESGGAFVISTGRLPGGILPRVKELGLTGKVCCCNGAVIIDTESKEVLMESRLSLEGTLAACKKMEELGLHIHAYDLWDFYVNMDDDILKLYEKMVKTTATLVLDKPLSEFLEEKERAVFKLVAMVDPEKNAEILSVLSKENFDGCVVTKSASYLVEVINKNHSKGTAIEVLANYYKTPLDKVIAIGDQLNDMEMIEKAGLGIAVKNAETPLKEKADYVSEYTNEESAIADIIEKFGFCH